MKFSPHIFSCFLLLAESHATLHAWPEYDYCAINPFTCAIGKDTMPRIQRVKEAFGTDYFAIHKTIMRPKLKKFLLHYKFISSHSQGASLRL